MEPFEEQNLKIDKIDVAFQTVVSFRDATSIASKKQITYEQSLQLIHDLDPQLYEKFYEVLSEHKDNPAVKLYKQRAEILSLKENKIIKASELLKEDIEREKKLLEDASVKKNIETEEIEKNIVRLSGLIPYLEPTKLSETEILIKDYSNVDRTKIFGEAELINKNKHIDYLLSGNRALRLRLFHPNKEENITGADLVYEQYDLSKNAVRIVFLQYKTWKNGAIYLSQNKNLKSQLNKLQQFLCECGHCNSPKETNSFVEYRMPYCCGFLRATDQLQFKHSKMISSGIHIPVCNVIKHFERENVLYKKFFEDKTINHYVFEKLFNSNLIGSRWLNVDEVERFYKENKILDTYDTLKIYAREFID